MAINIDSQPKILLITSNVAATSAQGVRYINLFNFFKEEFSIYHLVYEGSVLDNSFVKIVKVKLVIDRILSPYITKAFRKLFRQLLFPDNYIALISLYKRELKKLQVLKFDYVIIGMTPFSLIKLNPYIKELYPEAKLINDFSDPFSANSEFAKWSFLRKKARNYERKYLPFADLQIVLNDRIKDYYVKNYRINVKTVEQGINKIFSDKSVSIEISGIFNLIYAGNFYKGFRDPSQLFKAIKNISFPLKLTIYGGKGVSNSKINAYKSVLRLAYVSQKELHEAYLKSHLLIVIDNFFGIQVPGKTLECFAHSRPVLLIYNNLDSPTLEYTENTSGIFIVQNNSSLIKQKIEYIYENYLKIQKSCDPKQYFWETLSLKYLNYLNEIE